MKQIMITPKEYIGKDEKIAMDRAKNKGFVIRITERDGKADMLTMDYRSDRINFKISNGIVIDAYGG